MATLSWDDADLTVNSVDLSAHVQSVSLTYSADELDETAMGDSTHSRIGGLKDWSISVTFNQDFAASQVDATLFSIVGTTFTVVLKPTSAAVSATNPSFTGSAHFPSYGFGGGVGSLLQATAQFNAAGALTRATS